MQIPQKQKGFTLLELLLVMAILVLLAGISFALYDSSGRANVLAATQKTIISDLLNAREKAINGESFLNWGIHFDGTNNNYQIFSSPTDYSDAGKTIVSTTYLNNGITFSAPGIGSTTNVVFNKVTGATANATITIIASGGFSANVAVLASGLVYDGTAPAAASIAFVQQNNKAQAANISTDNTITMPAAITSGNTLVVAVSSWPGTPAAASVFDTLGNSFNMIGTVQTTGTNSKTAIYYANITHSGTDTVDFFLTSATSETSIVAAEFSGLNASAPLDVNNGTNGNSTSTNPTALTPSTASELMVAEYTHDSSGTTSAGSGFTMAAIATDNDSTFQPLAMEYKIVNTTAALAGNFTFTGIAATWAENQAFFKQ